MKRRVQRLDEYHSYDGNIVDKIYLLSTISRISPHASMEFNLYKIYLRGVGGKVGAYEFVWV